VGLVASAQLMASEVKTVKMNDSRQSCTDCMCGTKSTWRCTTCCIPLCTSCFVNHLDAFDKHHFVETIDWQTTFTTSAHPEPSAQNNIDAIRKELNELKKQYDGPNFNGTIHLFVVKKSNGSHVMSDMDLVSREKLATSCQELKFLYSSLHHIKTRSLFPDAVARFENFLYKVNVKCENDEIIFTGIAKDYAGFIVINDVNFMDDGSDYAGSIVACAENCVSRKKCFLFVLFISSGVDAAFLSEILK